MIKRIFLIAIVAGVLLLTVQVIAHDYWLEPDPFIMPVGSKVNVHMYLGQHFLQEVERPFQKASTVSFQLLSAGGARDLSAAGRDGEVPTAQVELKRAGNYLIAMERKPQTITLDAEKFTEYLKEEGLEAIIEERKRAGESSSLGRERYTRYLKSLLQVGDRNDETYKRIVAHRLEIIPEKNPYRIKIGDTLAFKVNFEGKPLGDVKVFVYNRNGGKVYPQTAITSRDGRADFKLDRSGLWLIRLVYMRRCAGCDGLDWESFWTAYTFAVK